MPVSEARREKTAERKEHFLEALKDSGSVSKALEAIGAKYSAIVSQWKRNDREFAKRFEEIKAELGIGRRGRGPLVEPKALEPTEKLSRGGGASRDAA